MVSEKYGWLREDVLSIYKKVIELDKTIVGCSIGIFKNDVAAPLAKFFKSHHENKRLKKIQISEEQTSQS